MYDILVKLEKKPDCLEMLGTGRETRDFVFVKDVVDALILVAQDKIATGQTYNVGSGTPTKIAELVNIVLEMLEMDVEVGFAGASWKGDVKSLVADISKITKIGYQPNHSLREGLKQLILWHNPKLLKG
jgi:UDP-glucose 4-epimerase